METEKKLTIYVTKLMSHSNGARFAIKATVLNVKKSFNLDSNYAFAVTDPKANLKYEKERDKIKIEFHNILTGIFDNYELYKIYNERLDFNMKFGDEYKAWASVSGHEDKDGRFYTAHCSEISIPLNEEEIMFFFRSLEDWIVIKNRTTRN